LAPQVQSPVAEQPSPPMPQATQAVPLPLQAVAEVATHWEPTQQPLVQAAAQPEQTPLVQVSFASVHF
jgi:hypothetical protein